MKTQKRIAATAPLVPHPEYSKSPTTKASSGSHRFFLSHSDSEDSDDYRHHSAASTRRSPKHATSRHNGALSPERPQSITQKRQQKQRLKLESNDGSEAPREMTRGLADKSPEAWFQRVMRTKQLSPLDLCDLFSYGDARRHQTVPLSHVCEVIFALDPEAAVSGHDPVTPAMEEFLYEFSFEDDDSDGARDAEREIVVSVKDALRSLDIWRSGAASPSTKPSANAKSMPPAKSTVLEAKNKQLQSVISSLQSANLRLSQQLDAAVLLQKPASSITAPTPPHETSALLSSMLLGSSSAPALSARAVPHAKSAVVNQHEDALVKIANRLQYSGVKQLEELLLQSDSPQSVLSADAANSVTSPSGFVTLKLLRWLLVEHFQLDITETELMESCLGINFSAQAKLDYHEFVHVLLDILIYAFPTASSARRQQLYQRIREYVAAGFGAADSCASDAQARTRHRELLARLCEKYDVEGDRLISVADIMRVLYKDLARLHALNLAFPLTQQDALRVVQPFVRETTAEGRGATTSPSGSNSTGGFLSYQELVDALFAEPGDDDEPDTGRTAPALRLHPALDWAFWAKLRKALCGGNLALEPAIHAQLCKIFKKLDPAPRQFLVSQRNFARVLDQHLGAEELDALASALAASKASGSSSGDAKPSAASSPPVVELLRFDVFMKLVFGAPALQDAAFLNQHIITTLALHEARIRASAVELLKQHGGGWEVTPSALYALLTSPTPDNSEMRRSSNSTTHPREKEAAAPRELTVTESLYLFALLDDDHAGHSTRQTLVRCMDAYNLERTLSGFKSGPHGGRVSQDELLKAIYRMLSALGLDAHDSATLDPASLQQLISTIAVQTNDADPDLLQSGRLHLLIAVDAFFDALFDWDAMARGMRLPQQLVEAKRGLELFDWHKDGSVALQDWSKAWRVACPDSERDMAEWELRVLQRRFPAGAGRRGQRPREDKQAGRAADDAGGGIDYARLLMHLMASQQQHARQRLKDAVVAHFQGLCAPGGTRKPLSAQGVDTLFRQIDTEGKGHFNMRDLQAYLTSALSGTEAVRSDNSGEHPLENVNVVAQALGLLAGSRDADNGATATTVTRTRFHEFVRAKLRVITTVRDLELAILRICREIAGDGDLILPTRALRYLLQRVLLQRHELRVSTLIVSQFFEHIGAGSSALCLEPLLFAQWVAPLTVATEATVRAVVRKMVVRSKGGGGRVDLDRFLGQLHRKLLDSPEYAASAGDSNGDSASAVRCVSPALLLSKLNLLGVPLTRHAMDALRRHFGMEEDAEIDVALFLQRIYELGARLPLAE
ncbi:hypothetical protein PybrP1_008612 [[Pythium] brassicae (nom. inval.)]|nr:hypothetical protein PybrP1_008612 [[Pythium] brassicae (nom. inval.)]